MTATINGVVATRLHLSEPRGGVWFLDADLVDDTAMSGRVDCVLADITLSGTISPFESGTFGLRRSVRITGGADGWSKLLRARSYPNDAGVSAALVARDAATECGETIGAFAAATPTLGLNWTRDAGPASRALERASGGYNWWVGRDGVTNVGPRPVHTPTPGSYTVLSHKPASNEALIAFDSLDDLRVGSVLTERLDSPQTVQALDIMLDGAELRARAWFGRGAAATSNLGDLLQGIIRRTTDQKLFGHYDYRVVSMADDRVNIQAITPADGVPDLVSIDMTPGVAGMHAELTEGAEVLVIFVAGDRGRPRIVNFGGKRADGHIPQSLTIMGGSRPSAAQGDLVECPTLGVTVIFDIPPGGTVPPIPTPMMTLTPYVLSFGLLPPTPLLSGSLYGTIASGEPSLLQP